LKLCKQSWRDLCRQVAPHAGAWIETVNNRYHMECERVAPHAGAWIET